MPIDNSQPLDDQPQGAPTPEPVLEAQPVELEYAGPRNTNLIGRKGKRLVVPLQIVLPPMCVKTGQTQQEAAAEGRSLMEYDATLYWAPWWTLLIVVVGCIGFGPVVVVGIVLYFVFRRKVRIRLSIRRDQWWKRRLVGTALTLLTILLLASLLVGSLEVGLEISVWWWIAGLGVALAAGICAVLFGRILWVQTVKNEWAFIGGADQRFMERMEFDFIDPA